MKDGRLLKPTHPAMSIDSTFIQRVFGSGGPDGQLWAAFTEVCRLKSVEHSNLINIFINADR